MDSEHVEDGQIVESRKRKRSRESFEDVMERRSAYMEQMTTIVMGNVEKDLQLAKEVGG